MEIKITNPYLVTPTIGYSLEGQASEAQIIRIIEKLLLTKSIIAESISIKSQEVYKNGNWQTIDWLQCCI